MKQTLLSIASELGITQPLLSAYARISDDVRAPSVDDRIRTFSSSEDACKGSVLFPVIPGYATWVYRACILGHVFRTRGYRPILLVADDFGISPAATVDENETKAAELSRFYLSSIPEQFGMDTRSVATVISTSRSSPGVDVLDDGYYRGVDVDRYATASSRKYLKRYSLDDSDPDVRAVHEAFVGDGIRLADACHTLLETHDIVATVVNEPAYVQGGVPADVVHDHGVPAMSQMLGYRDETILFGRVENRSTQPQFTEADVVEEALATPLRSEERERIERIMAGRRTGDTSAIHYAARTDRSVDVPDDVLLVGMFTNLLWDASLVPDVAPFTDVYDWIEATLDAFEDRDDSHLVLKTHPAEAKFGTRESVTGWLEQRDDPLPANVTVLPPTTDVNTYELVDELDVGIVYTSTVGLEMAYEGVPVVVGGDTHYRGFGFTTDPTDPREYRRVLDGLESFETTETTKRRARRYAYLLFVRKHVNVPYCATDGSQSHRLRRVDHDELAPGTDPWDGIVEAILSGDEVLAPL